MFVGMAWIQLWIPHGTCTTSIMGWNSTKWIEVCHGQLFWLSIYTGCRCNPHHIMHYELLNVKYCGTTVMGNMTPHPSRSNRNACRRSNSYKEHNSNNIKLILLFCCWPQSVGQAIMAITRLLDARSYFRPCVSTHCELVIAAMKHASHKKV